MSSDTSKTDSPTAFGGGLASTRTVGPPLPAVDDVAAAEALVGSVVGGRFRLEEVLGQGGMGAVYRASQPDGPEVAIKLVRGDKGELNEQVLPRFFREVEATMAIDNPHVVRVLSAGTDEASRLPFLALELLRGSDLSALIGEHGPLDPALTARVFVQACRGLEAIHRLDFIHRDIKPSNLFLHEQDGRIVVKVCDLGIAKQQALSVESAPTELTNTGGMVGSPHYMSPEQVQDAKHVSQSADIWSLAMALYEALTGHKGFGACTTVGEILVAICTREVPPLKVAAPWLPDGLAEVVLKGLRRAPGERHASMAAFRQALEPFAAPEEALRVGVRWGLPEETRGLARPPGLPSLAAPVSAPVRGAPARPGWVLPVVLLVGVLAGVAGVQFLSRTAPAPPVPSASAVVILVSASAPPAPRMPPLNVTFDAVSEVRASSSLPTNPGKYAFDERPVTAHCEGSAGDGVGEWVEARIKPGVVIEQVEVDGGWPSRTADGTIDLWAHNNSYRVMRVSWAGGEALVTFDRKTDRGVKKRVDVGVATPFVRITAVEVDRGRFNDLCLGDVVLYGRP